MASTEEERRGLYRELDQVRLQLATANGLIADLQVQVAVNASSIKSLKDAQEENVSQDEFAPIKRLVWGFVGTILTCVAMAVLALILNKPTLPPLH